MTIKIKGSERSIDLIELQRVDLWVDVLINGRIVCTFFDDGDASLCDAKTDNTLKGRWKEE